MKLRAAAVILSGLTLACAAFVRALPASAERCVSNGDIVTLDGIASLASPMETHHSAWVLHLGRPVCVVRRSPHAPIETIIAIRIIGTPPPLNIPLQLTGKLLLGGTSLRTTMFAALAVTSGRKETPADSQAPHLPVSAAAPLPSAAAPQQGGGRCESPPYGGTPADYQTFVRRFGPIIKPQKILSGICNAKFGSASRDGLHKLGFTDAKIQSENTEKLAAETIVALKKLVNTIE